MLNMRFAIALIVKCLKISPQKKKPECVYMNLCTVVNGARTGTSRVKMYFLLFRYVFISHFVLHCEHSSFIAMQELEQHLRAPGGHLHTTQYIHGIVTPNFHYSECNHCPFIGVFQSDCGRAPNYINPALNLISELIFNAPFTHR